VLAITFNVTLIFLPFKYRAIQAQAVVKEDGGTIPPPRNNGWINKKAAFRAHFWQIQDLKKK
jgi:hypothetical protein